MTIFGMSMFLYSCRFSSSPIVPILMQYLMILCILNVESHFNLFMKSELVFIQRTAFVSIILMAIYKALCKGKIIYFFHSFSSFQNSFFVVISISLFIFLSPLPPAKRNILLFLSHIPKSVAIKFNNPCDV